LATIDMRRKSGVCRFWEGELGPHVTQCSLAWAEAYLRTKWHLDPSSPLAQQTWAEIGGGETVAFGSGMGPHLTQWCPGEVYHRSKSNLDPSSRLATTNMGRKWGVVPPFWEGAGSPSSTIWHGPRPTSIPSGILIHPAIWTIDMGRKLGGALPPF